MRVVDCSRTAVLYIPMSSLIYCMSTGNIKIELYSLCLLIVWGMMFSDIG